MPVGTPVLADVALEVFPEVLEGAVQRHHRAGSQGAEGMAQLE
jgi:hypothetical protein